MDNVIFNWKIIAMWSVLDTSLTFFTILQGYNEKKNIFKLSLDYILTKLC